MGKGLTSYLEGLSQEDSENIMHVLEGMTDKELKAYSDKYDKLIDTVNERAESRYEPQVEEINNGFINRVRELMGQLPEEMQKLGVESIEGFVSGFIGNSSTFIETMGKKFDKMFEDFNENVTTDSDKTYTPNKTTGQDIESNSALSKSGKIASALMSVKDRIKTNTDSEKSFIDSFSENTDDNGPEDTFDSLFESMSDSAYLYGEQAAIRYMEGFEDELNRTYESIMAERAFAASGMTAGQQMASFNYYSGAPQSGSNKSEKIVLENKADITVKLDRDVLGKKMMEWTKHFERRTGT